MEKEPWYPIRHGHQKIFFPTLRFQNEKDVAMKPKFGPKQDETYYWMKYPHHLEYKNTKKITIYCSFDFSTFPFDSHMCNLTYGINFYSESYIHMMSSTVLHKKKPTVMGEPPLLGKWLSNEHYID